MADNDRKSAAFWGICLAACMAVLSCASTGGGTGGDLSLDEAIDQSAAEVLAELPGGTRVAIATFTTDHAALSHYIMDELTGALVAGNLEVADYRNLEYVYQQLDFQMSGEVSDAIAVSIGKFLGARYVIAGQFMKAGGHYRYRLSVINIETAIRESSPRHNVRDDRALRALVADVRQAPAVTATAGYGRNAQPSTAGTFLRGRVYANKGDYDRAIADYTQVTRLAPNVADAYFYRGFAYYCKSNYARARADWTEALRLNPGLAQARDNLEALRREGH